MRDGLDQPGGRGHDGLRRAVCRAAKKKDHTAPMARAERHGQRERETERQPLGHGARNPHPPSPFAFPFPLAVRLFDADQT